ncbi:MAG: hypothetical protein IKQ18_06895, partial [Clostridia bacterium]|nr:hypothetical protein [Clostridia bacterium]
ENEKLELCENEGIHEDIVQFVKAKLQPAGDYEELANLLDRTANSGKTTETIKIPQNKGAVLSYLYANATVISVDYEDDGTTVTATLDKKTLGAVKKMLGG